jgi:uncharacterized protein YlxP (DUF503 family)
MRLLGAVRLDPLANASLTPLFMLVRLVTGFAMVVGVLRLDLLLGDVRSLKQKRSVIRPVVAELRRRFQVAVAESGHGELHRRAEIGVAAVASTHQHVVEVLDGCERLVAGLPQVDLLAARRRVLDDDDLE